MNARRAPGLGHCRTSSLSLDATNRQFRDGGKHCATRRPTPLATGAASSASASLGTPSLLVCAASTLLSAVALHLAG